ncbi:MAG: 16S rRNA (cytidine(1402)-2'-O)-methyltransferase [Oribacterium sp.]|jgi:16S rRNA (cytidine1402-2'-O)-methyltransferase|nr:16S rRNA (cytidine(1402)-2'-O)-methyltransferase [Oribacterium sp.]MDY6315790.1 16S rRNA (cytidine(1402)-2'-O)-methyltransferase [Oribacterium sp.]
MAGTLYVCATPIGNLEDITFRVLETLKRVDLIAAEDTRNSIHLLNHFEIKTPMTAYHEYNKYDKAKSLVQMLLDGKDIAIITDAGTPCISDPGEELVRQAAEAGITVTSLPGPAACITALTISALPTRRFAFEAFLPTEKADKKERARILEELKSETRTMIVYEAPHHLKETLADLASSLGADRRISLCRELTKKHEEVIRTTLGDAIAKYEAEEPRGEYVLVIEGKDPAAIQAETEASWNEMPLADHMQHYLDQGMPEKDAMKQVAKDRGISKRDVYQQWKVKNS